MKMIVDPFPMEFGLTTAHRRVAVAAARDEHSTELSAKLAYGDNGILSGVMAGGTPI